MGVRVTGIFAVLCGFNAEKKLQTLSKITHFCGGFRGEEAAVRVTEFSAGWRGFNVEKKLRKQLKVAAFCGRIVETVNQAAILTGLNCCNVERESQTLSSGAVFGSGGFCVGEAEVRVAEISAGWSGFNVEKNLRKPSKVAAFCGRIVETVNQAAILTGLYCCNVERESQTLSNGAIFGSGGFRGQEPAERVAGISAGLNCFNAEKKLQTLLKVTAAGGELVGEPISRVTVISVLLNSINVEKNPGMSEKVAVENSLGNDFYKRSVKKCRYE